MELREYQQECVDTIIDRFKQGHDNALAVLPPGSGKSIIFSEIVRKSRRKVLLITNQNKLVKQGADNIKRFIDEDIGYYNAGLGIKDLDKRVTVASIQSIWRNKTQFYLIIVDEAHRFHWERGMLASFLKHQKDYKLLGLTATAYTSNEYIYGENKNYESVTFERSFQEMTDNGYLVPIRYTSGKKETLI